MTPDSLRMKIPDLPIEAGYVVLVILLAWLGVMLYVNWQAGVRWSAYWENDDED